MRIIEIIPTLSSGGGEKFVVDLCNELVKQGHEVTLVTLFDYDETFIFEKLVNRDVKRVSLHKKYGLDLCTFFKVLNIIREIAPDAVHAHVGAIKYLMLSAVIYRKCKYYATIHSEAGREAGKGFNLYSRKILFKKKYVTAITISEESLKSFVHFYGISTPMIMNGCSEYVCGTSIPHYHSGVDFLFIHIGRLNRIKNQLRLVKAFKRLLDEGYKARLLIIGRKEHDDVYDAISIYFSDYIVYLGEKDNCRDYMNIADAFCLSSDMEGMPISVIEALSVGCIPIVTPVGGCVNILTNRVDGFVAKECSDEAYYNSLEEFVTSNAQDRYLLSAKGKKIFADFYSISICAKKYVELFKGQLV